jgi:hypothetical protein
VNRSRKNGASHAASAIAWAPLANGRSNAATIKIIHDPGLITPVLTAALNVSGAVWSVVGMNFRSNFSALLSVV